VSDEEQKRLKRSVNSPVEDDDLPDWKREIEYRKKVEWSY
jgi:hypothetical protein